MSFCLEFLDGATLGSLFRSLKEMSDEVRIFVKHDALEINEMVGRESLAFQLRLDRAAALRFDFSPEPGTDCIELTVLPNSFALILKSASAQDSVRFTYSTKTPETMTVHCINTELAHLNFEYVMRTVQQTSHNEVLEVQKQPVVAYTFTFKPEVLTGPIDDLVSLEKDFTGLPLITVTTAMGKVALSLGDNQQGSMINKARICIGSGANNVVDANKLAADKKRRAKANAQSTAEMDEFCSRLPTTHRNPGEIRQSFRISHLRAASRLFNANKKNNNITVHVAKDAPMVFTSVVGAMLGSIRVTLMFEDVEDEYLQPDPKRQRMVDGAGDQPVPTEEKPEDGSENESA